MLKDRFSSQLLAILFASSEPVTFAQLGEVFPDLSQEALSDRVDRLIEAFNSLQEAVHVRRVGGGIRITTRPEHHDIVRSYLKTKPSAKLSLAALETLAVIAYRQTVTLSRDHGTFEASKARPLSRLCSRKS